LPVPLFLPLRCGQIAAPSLASNRHAGYSHRRKRLDRRQGRDRLSEIGKESPDFRIEIRSVPAAKDRPAVDDPVSANYGVLVEVRCGQARVPGEQAHAVADRVAAGDPAVFLRQGEDVEVRVERAGIVVEKAASETLPADARVTGVF